MTGIRQAMADETRSRVVATARELFGSKGYFATGTTEIVQAAGVGTRGALYHHFSNKEALFEAVLVEMEQDLGAKVHVCLTASSAHERLDQALNAFLDFSLDPEVRRILLIDAPAVLGWQRWRELEAENGLGSLAGLIQEGVDEGTIVAADVIATAHLLLSMVDEAALFIAHSDDQTRARAAAGDAVTALVSGIAARKP